MATSGDELMLMLGSLPAGSEVDLFLPGLLADRVIDEAARRSGARLLTKVNENTVRLPVSDVVFVPVPGEVGANLGGLLTVTLPDGIVRGQEFRVLAHQVSRDPHRVVGTFEVSVPVSTKNELIDEDVRRLSVLRHIFAAIPATDRWYAIFATMLGQLEARVRDLGVDPDRIAPSPDGDGLQSWPMYRCGATRRGQSPFAGPQTHHLRWRLNLGGAVRSSPVIAAHGTIYVGSSDHRVYAIRPNGTVQWSFATGARVLSAAALGSDGTIYIGSDDRKLYALHPDGTLKWSYVTAGEVRSSPAIAPDGTLYVGSDGNRVSALDPDGRLKWQYRAGGDVWSSPAIGPDGTIYVGSDDNRLYALTSEGTKKWHFATGADVKSTPAIAADGTIYVGSEDDRLYAVDAHGREKWHYHTGDDVKSSPAIGADGTIFVGSDGNRLHALRPNGTKIWDFVGLGNFTSSPAVGADGKVYVGCDDNRICALHPNGTLQWSYATGADVVSSPAIATGVLYVGSDDHHLYAIGDPA